MKTCNVAGIILVFVIFAASGCNSQSGKADTASQSPAQPAVKAAEVKKIVVDPTNPCPILTKEEVGAVMKVVIEDAEPANGGCSYYTGKPEYMAFDVFAETPNDPLKGFKDAKKEHEDGAKKYGGFVKEIKGLGDFAFYRGETNSAEKWLFVLKGKHLFTFAARQPGMDRISEEGIKALAGKALEKI